jgi:stage V sporulation protein G
MEGIVMRFTVERMFRLPDAGKLKAFCDVCIYDEIVIKGVRVLEGKHGLFISLPQEQGRNAKWYDQVVCKTASIYEELASTVLDFYRNNGRSVNEWQSLQ